MRLLNKWIPNLEIALGKLAGGGAVKGQDIRWLGTLWGPSGPVIETVTATGNLANNEQDVVLVDSATPVTITLNFQASTRVRPLHIKKIGAGNVTINSAFSETFDGDTFVGLKRFDSALLIPSGGAFWLL